jgi:hypothetical protein
MRYVEAGLVIAFWLAICTAFVVVRGVGGFIARFWRKW